MTITVLIPTIPGREDLLRRALDSIRTQTLQPDQVLVELDTGRTGAAATRNRALAKGTGEWVAFLDDDDTLYPHHLERLQAALASDDADLAFPWFDGINCRGVLTTVADSAPVEPFGVAFGPEQREHLLTRANFIPITVMARTSLIRQVGGFTPPPWASPDNPCEDWGCWVKLLNAGARFVHVPEITWTWHGHAGHTSGRALSSHA
jgi:glycosyltransferase involved in cell wall biosynthesis